ncbi:MAG TPA: diguanylate cyclase [Terriglobales bacterium]|nr:diguanylate cyclase [Terriglobales bacterium]
MKKIAILYDASQAVISTFDLDEVLTRILEIARDCFHLKFVAVLLLDEKAQQLHMRSHLGYEGALFSVKVGQGLIGTAAATRRSVHAPDVTKDSRYINGLETTRSELALPLIARDQVLGVLDCQSEKPNFFDPEMIDLLRLFSTQASIALQNARLYSQEQRKAAQLEAINLIARQTTAVLDINDLLSRVCEFLLQAFPIEHVAIMLLEDDKLIFRAHSGRLTPLLKVGTPVPDGGGVCREALATRQPILANDVSSNPHYIEGFKETQSELCIPLLSFGQIVGVLCLESDKLHAFDSVDIPPLESVADICANAIQNAHYFERVRHMAYVDGLTGIFNRRYFEIRVLEEIERAKRYSGSMSLVMVDIDHFKRLNDEFGHLMGDDVLRQISNLFTQNLRKVDVGCRYGGEEFAIIVPETTGEDAYYVADKLRKVIETAIFPGVPRPVTISVGVASYPANATNRDELIKAADEALYAAKQSGRNTVVPAASIVR